MQGKRIVNAIDHAAELVARINKAAFAICCVILIVATVFTVYEAFARYALNKPLSYGVELGAYYLLIISLVPVGQVLLADRHIRIDILFNKFPALLKRSLDAFSYLLAFGVGVVISWEGIEMASSAFHQGWKSFILSVPLWIPISVVPLTGILLSFAAAARAWRAARAKPVDASPAEARTEG